MINIFYETVVDCGSLPNPENGFSKLESGRTTFGALVHYTCRDNFTLVGDERRKCGDGGIWSGHQPQCLCKKTLSKSQLNIDRNFSAQKIYKSTYLNITYVKTYLMLFKNITFLFIDQQESLASKQKKKIKK